MDFVQLLRSDRSYTALVHLFLLDHDELAEAGNPLIPMTSDSPFIIGWLGRRGRRVWVAISVGRFGMHLEMEKHTMCSVCNFETF